MNVINGDAEAKALMIVRVHSLLSAEEKEKYKLVDNSGNPVSLTNANQQKIISVKFSEAYFTLPEGQRKALGKIENLTDVVKILFETKRDWHKAWSWISKVLSNYTSIRTIFFDRLGFVSTKKTTEDTEKIKRDLFKKQFESLDIDRQIALTDFANKAKTPSNRDQFIKMLFGDR
jgi:hypothetical protein